MVHLTWSTFKIVKRSWGLGYNYRLERKTPQKRTQDFFFALKIGFSESYYWKKILDNSSHQVQLDCNWLLGYHHFWIIMICAIYILMSSAAYLVETSPLTAQLMKGCWRNGHGVELLRFWLLYENDLLLISVIMYRFLPEF